MSNIKCYSFAYRRCTSWGVISLCSPDNTELLRPGSTQVYHAAEVCSFISWFQLDLPIFGNRGPFCLLELGFGGRFRRRRKLFLLQEPKMTSCLYRCWLCYKCWNTLFRFKSRSSGLWRRVVLW